MKKQKTDLQIKKDEIRKQILEKRSNLNSIFKKCPKYNDFYGYEK